MVKDMTKSNTTMCKFNSYPFECKPHSTWH